jgi:GDPmannose 4,6-dehydratase
MLQQTAPDDFVLATGETHTVREFVTLAAEIAGIDLRWEGAGLSTRGIDGASGDAVVLVDPAFYRPAEVDLLVGNASRAREALGWRPTTSFRRLVESMIEADLARVKSKSLAAIQ